MKTPLENLRETVSKFMQDDLTALEAAIRDNDLLTDIVGRWATTNRDTDFAARTHAVVQGIAAAAIESCRPIANPYSPNSVWRWCWYTGFDLGGRIHRLQKELVALANAAVPGPPTEDGVWVVKHRNNREYVATARLNISGHWVWVVGDDDELVFEDDILMHRKHIPLEVPNG